MVQELDYINVVNYPLVHNHVALCKALKVTNDSDVELSNVVAELSGEYVRPFSSAILDRLVAGQSVVISPFEIAPMPDLLIQLTERVVTEFSVVVSADGQEVSRAVYSLELMPFDHWAGLSVMPQTIASFVTPNHPAVVALVAKAAQILQSTTGSSAFCAYQRGQTEDVCRQVAAIMGAVNAEGISYVQLPPSFESVGQRVRTPQEVLSSKLGNCIELSVLLASALEAVGIGTGLVFMQGHAFLAVWLVDDCCRTGICDDVFFLEKRCADGIGEMLLIESTFVTSEGMDVDEASSDAIHSLGKHADFHFMVDVRRSRLEGFLPMPQRVLADGTWRLEEAEGVDHGKSNLVFREPDRYDLSDIGVTKRELSRLDVWERRLLDFSLRNAMLNINMGRRKMWLLGQPWDVEDALQGGRELTITHRVSGLNYSDDGNVRFNPQDSASVAPLILSDMQHDLLHSQLAEVETRNALRGIYRAARVAIEESGANSLYVALGLLQWTEGPESERVHHAPLLLLPVEMVYKRGQYHVRVRDEEVFFNISLAEFLKQNFGIEIPCLDNLPKDDAGVDVRKMFAIVRSAIANQDRWDVEDSVVLGIFSFAKYVLWNDIHTHRDLISANPIVGSIVRNQYAGDAQPLTPDLRQADRDSNPQDLPMPLPADSSQRAAVMAAVSGRSFILYGPPGTGKSQTITNIIACALHQRKRVLFVAEKMAALSVVQNRLEKIGLGPFCLEMHSNKVTKRHVLDQLAETLHLATLPNRKAEFQKSSDDLLERRRDFIAVMDALHSVGPDGFSVYDLISRYEAIPTAELDAFPMPDALRAGLSLSSLADYDDVLRDELPSVISVVGNPSVHPLLGLRIGVEAVSHPDDFRQALSALSSAVSAVLQHYGVVRTLLPELQIPEDAVAVPVVLQFEQAVAALPFLSPQLVDGLMSPDSIALLSSCAQACAERDELRRSVLASCREEVLGQDPVALSMQWHEASSKWFLPRFFACRSFVSKMRFFSPSLTAESVTPLLDNLLKLQNLNKSVAEYQSRVDQVFGRAVGPDALRALVESAPRLAECLGLVASVCGVSQRGVAQALRGVASDDLLARCQQTEAIAADWRQACDSLSAFAKTDKSSADADYCSVLSVSLQRWLTCSLSLKDWYQWCAFCDRLRGLGLDVIIGLFESGAGADSESCNATTLPQAFFKRYFRQRAEESIAASPSLALFEGMLFRQKVRQYKRMEADFRSLSQQIIVAGLRGNVPRLSEAAASSSELGILGRNISNGGRGLSLRALLDQIPHLLPALCPCMLMSPMSAAQYIDLSREPFDLVIFDEASQMPTSEAVGAIARGKSLVVVGDPKQMPPTSFFSTSQVDEEDAAQDDLESVLEDCRSLQMPSLQLAFHYRSRHESLIAFSNNEYYDGSLITFPSADAKCPHLRHVHVDGVYEKGGKRQNRAEAEAVVADVKRRLSSGEPHSIGIIAFSSPQQNLIEDLLLDMLDANRSLREAADALHEPIFVKNLENVQGDERDVILFSIGYGPDKNGVVSMNFGPLNNAGGERRLNVAVSRARCEMSVFATLRSAQIDLQRSQAKGVAGLKHFLEYAESQVFVPSSSSTSAHADAVVAQQVAEALRQMGFVVSTGVGCSKFKVDVAVASPDQPDRFRIGILLDGIQYQQTPTTADRLIVQPEVLGGLGWRVLRLWTVEWAQNRDRFLDLVGQMMAEPDAVEEDPQPEASSADAESDAAVSDLDAQSPAEPLADPSDAGFPQRSSYMAYSVPADAVVPPDIADLVREIVDLEQPIALSYLCKRVACLSGVRVTPSLQRSVASSLGLYAKEEDERLGAVVWKSSDAHEAFCGFRSAGGREMADIPTVELRNAMLALLHSQFSMSDADLRSMTVRAFGLVRRTAKVDEILSVAIRQLCDAGKIKSENGRWLPC